ncbi:hypothetical protein QBC46DRAFT_405934 [Diplogelasinospora grovesii]|uniref:Uncharacterized protein n=1 Tax=Diplogelasinospora grovesii TaxID=303347 RepID=A0AAN6S729_9PEZI|nr:hypothetical protein QBC46DRAFT_405934 [Diplogelasinospora grovesii]
MPDLWTPKTREEFHRGVETLIKVQSKLGLSPRHYDRSSNPRDLDTSHDYTLRLQDELQLADHIAFLAHAQEGAFHVSAACVCETPEGLVIRVTSNETPGSATVSGLRNVLQVIQDYANAGRRRAEFQERLFDAVVEQSRKRITQRLRPRWYRARMTGRNEPLLGRLEALVSEIRQLDRNSTLTRENLETLIRSLEPFFNRRPADEDMNAQLKEMVMACFTATVGGDTSKSLEDQFQNNPHLSALGEQYGRAIQQVDKIARHFLLCKEILKICRTPESRETALFRSIDLQTKPSPPGITPPGATKICYAYAEVQLILWNERDPPSKPPRAIGCSKSACLLCDLFIGEVGKYRISYTHLRPYNQWMIPECGAWLNESQINYYRGVIKRMTTEINRLINLANSNGNHFKHMFLESHAALPLFSGPSSMTASIISHQSLSLPVPPGQVRQAVAAASRASSLASSSNETVSAGSPSGSVRSSLPRSSSSAGESTSLISLHPPSLPLASSYTALLGPPTGPATDGDPPSMSTISQVRSTRSRKDSGKFVDSEPSMSAPSSWALLEVGEPPPLEDEALPPSRPPRSLSVETSAPPRLSPDPAAMESGKQQHPGTQLTTTTVPLLPEPGLHPGTGSEPEPEPGLEPPPPPQPQKEADSSELSDHVAESESGSESDASSAATILQAQVPDMSTLSAAPSNHTVIPTTVSCTTPTITGRLPLPAPTESATSASSSAISAHSLCLRLGRQDLPFECTIGKNSPTPQQLRLQIGDNFSVHFEVVAGLEVGKLAVSLPDNPGNTATGMNLTKDGNEGGIQVVQVGDMPTSSDMRLDCPRDSRLLRFRLCCTGMSVDVQISWGVSGDDVETQSDKGAECPLRKRMHR